MWDSICPKCQSYDAYVDLVTDGEHGGWVGFCRTCKYQEASHGAFKNASFNSPNSPGFEDRWPKRVPKKASQYLEE